MQFVPGAIFLLTMFVGAIWFSYDYYLMRTVLPILDSKNEDLRLLKADSYFAKSGRSAIYMYASAFPKLFAKNRKKLQFFATDHERFLYRINCYLGLIAAFGFCAAVLADWILDHRIYWW